jgi:RNA polymerase sigma factor (sigma-70 family)
MAASHPEGERARSWTGRAGAMNQRAGNCGRVLAVAEDDRALLERWCSGERDAGDELLERHFASLYRFFQSKCHGGDTDELVQATLVACLDAKDRFRGDASFRTFLFGVARHKMYRHLRDRKRDAELDVSTTSVAELVTTRRTVMARDQAHRALLEALRQLPVEQQTLLELHYWEELDTIELAGVFESPPATIRTWLFRARARLRELLSVTAPELLDHLEELSRKARPSA